MQLAFIHGGLWLESDRVAGHRGRRGNRVTGRFHVPDISDEDWACLSVVVTWQTLIWSPSWYFEGVALGASNCVHPRICDDLLNWLSVSWAKEMLRCMNSTPAPTARLCFLVRERRRPIRRILSLLTNEMTEQVLETRVETQACRIGVREKSITSKKIKIKGFCPVYI